MNPRKTIQEAHELAVMTLFTQWLGSHEGISYELVSRPDPPDGIYRSAVKSLMCTGVLMKVMKNDLMPRLVKSPLFTESIPSRLQTRGRPACCWT